MDCKTTLQIEMTEVPIIEYEQKIAFRNIMNLSLIQEFYYGENIFIIKRTGFIGKFSIDLL
ncbi:fatty acyl-CoA reductase wat-like isoform X2 [Vespula maculifrons]|uniref:Fatty acyl-CoA reductase wat-like isoform X2 n=1 Tax=Vespula maculifrons TaxID=7453 RepID=A0ABD2BPG0_VESMC